MARSKYDSNLIIYDKNTKLGREKIQHFFTSITKDMGERERKKI